MSHGWLYVRRFRRRLAHDRSTVCYFQVPIMARGMTQNAWYVLVSLCRFESTMLPKVSQSVTFISRIVGDPHCSL
jgi:hypothetical protein